MDVWNSAIDQSEEEPSLPVSNDKVKLYLSDSKAQIPEMIYFQDLVNDVFETSVDDDSSSQTDNEISVTAKLNGPMKSPKSKCDTNESGWS